jgi:hypothetical protein
MRGSSRRLGGSASYYPVEYEARVLRAPGILWGKYGVGEETITEDINIFFKKIHSTTMFCFQSLKVLPGLYFSN